jgi:hypothetical protein
MKRSIQVLMVATAVTIMMITGAALAFATTGTPGTAADCAVCHSAQAKVGAPIADVTATVKYAKCKTCHWLTSRTKTGYYTHRHGAGSNCADCHAAYGSGPSYDMSVKTAVGYFSTADYATLSAEELHRIHVLGSWPQTSAVPAACASCHAPAACDSCHVAPATHSGHAYNATNRDVLYAPALQLITRGTPVNKPSAVTARIQPQTCTNSYCHIVSADGVTISRPACADCHSPIATFGFRSVPVPVTTMKPVRVR